MPLVIIKATSDNCPDAAHHPAQELLNGGRKQQGECPGKRNIPYSIRKSLHLRLDGAKTQWNKSKHTHTQGEVNVILEFIHRIYFYYHLCFIWEVTQGRGSMGKYLKHSRLQDCIRLTHHGE